MLPVAVVLLLLGSSASVTAAAAPSSGISLSLGSNGAMETDLATVVANGSALRYAMDGYFGPLVEALPGTNASRAALLAEINATENNPLLAGLFGDRDGRVGATDIDRFESLVLNEAKLIPVSTFTGVLNVTLDGEGPLSDSLQSVSFTNAAGPDNSSAPLGVVATLSLTFTWSGTGASHVFRVAWNLPSILGNLSVAVQPVNLSFATPPAITITSVTGLNDTQISNDLLGWGPAGASGQYTPLPGHTIVVRFGPSFPTGDVLIAGAVGAAGVATLGLLLLRHRRRRRASGTPGPVSSSATDGVGPSSGSG